MIVNLKLLFLAFALLTFANIASAALDVGLRDITRHENGAREFVLPNGPIPAGSRIEVVGP